MSYHIIYSIFTIQYVLQVIREIGSFESKREPYVNYFNHLYLYPQALNLQGVKLPHQHLVVFAALYDTDTLSSTRKPLAVWAHEL